MRLDTAQYRYVGEDRLFYITVKGKDHIDIGRVFTSF